MKRTVIVLMASALMLLGLTTTALAVTGKELAELNIRLYPDTSSEAANLDTTAAAVTSDLTDIAAFGSAAIIDPFRRLRLLNETLFPDAAVTGYGANYPPHYGLAGPSQLDGTSKVEIADSTDAWIMDAEYYFGGSPATEIAEPVMRSRNWSGDVVGTLDDATMDPEYYFVGGSDSDE